MWQMVCPRESIFFHSWNSLVYLLTEDMVDGLKYLIPFNSINVYILIAYIFGWWV